MKKPTKKQRHEIYKLVLRKTIEYHKNKDSSVFLCNVITHSCDFDLSYFCEFNLFNPFFEYSKMDCWFKKYESINTRKHQQMIIEFCIQISS